MLHKLKRKFILIYMTSVMSITGMVLLFVFFSNYRHVQDNLKNAMSNALMDVVGGRFDNRPEGEPFDMRRGFHADDDKFSRFLPTLLFKLDANRNILETVEREMTIEEDEAKELVESVYTRHRQPFPTLDTNNVATSNFEIHRLENGLQYTVVSYLDYNYLLIMDNRFESEGLIRQRNICIAIFLASFLVFSALSFFFAKWAMNPVEKAWALQSRFIGDASHELRTPITVILANLDILLGKREEGIQQNIKWLEHSKTEANRMKSLVEDLLFLARAESKKNTYEMTKINLSDCLTERVLNLEVLAFEKGIEIEDRISENLTLVANENALKQLFTILLDNAIKYCNEKKLIKVSALKTDAVIQVRIYNTSAPLDKEVAEHIFERFYRADASRQRSEGGYGLGLSIAQNIANMHKAKLFVVNEEGGVAFVLEFRTRK